MRVLGETPYLLHLTMLFFWKQNLSWQLLPQNIPCGFYKWSASKRDVTLRRMSRVFVPTKGFVTCSSETAEEAIKVLKHTWLGFVAKLGCSFPWENRMNSQPSMMRQSLFGICCASKSSWFASSICKRNFPKPPRQNSFLFGGKRENTTDCQALISSFLEISLQYAFSRFREAARRCMAWECYALLWSA